MGNSKFYRLGGHWLPGGLMLLHADEPRFVRDAGQADPFCSVFLSLLRKQKVEPFGPIRGESAISDCFAGE